MGVVVHLDKFSGPMALLLHLIRQQEMDIFDINITEITKQYLDSIKAMKKLNLELAGDFIAMAATLIQIKSKMLLPQYNEQGEIVETEDPRKDLVKKLLEYQMFQEASQNLYARPLLGRNFWARGEREEIKFEDTEIIIEENALYALISCYRSAMKNMKKAVHRVASSLQSIADRIWQMRELLVIERPTQMSALVACGPEIVNSDPQLYREEKKGRLLITFLSLLELAKIGLVKIFQSDNFADIHVETVGQIDKDAISKVENYESQIGTNTEANPDIWMTPEEETAPQEAQLMLSSEELRGNEINMLEDFDNESVEVAQNEVLTMKSEVQQKVEDIYEVQAATDEEIELEEKLYGEEKNDQEIS